MNFQFPTLPVLRSLGGCGGTLLSRLFAAMPETIVLSETNPRSAHLFGGLLNPILQIRRWNPQFAQQLEDFHEYEIGFPPLFGRMLEELHRACVLRRTSLVLRDYNYVDFIGVPFVWPVPHDLSLDCSLEGRFNTRSIILAREPAEQLTSLRTHRTLARTLSAERFVAGSLAFLEALPDAAIFHYKDLVAQPADCLQRMCASLSLPFDPSALEQFAYIDAVTGNPRGRVSTGIEPPAPSAALFETREELARYRGYRVLRERLGY